VRRDARIDAAWAGALDERVPRAAWIVIDGDEVVAAREPDRWFSSASMIKTFLLAAVLEEVERGRRRLEEPLEVRSEHLADGDGVLRHFDLPVTLPLGDVLRLMVALSDNTATNAALDVVGLEVLNDRLAGWGFGSRMRSYVSQRERRWPGADAVGEGHVFISPPGLGMTSPAEHTRLVLALHRGELLPRLGTTAIAMLELQADRAGLARHLPGARFAHKTGSIDGVRHDGGLLRAGGRELAVACFTDGGPHPEWVDHPALVGMGLAMAATVELLGLDVDVAPRETRA
jgi:beta-lactamase class A